jgi:signal transduction histidine kinase
MSTATAASLINFLGFITGTVLYVMLLLMVLGSRRESNRLLLSAGFLGLAWNVGAFGGYGLISLGLDGPAPLLLATAFSALSFLPAVVVHSALKVNDLHMRHWSRLVPALGYLMSGAASIMQFYSAAVVGATPSQLALRAVTVGFAALLIVLLVLTRGQKERGRVLWVVAMAVFAVSALHLGNHQGAEDPWWLALAGHHASLPLALPILYQDFRFALADIFLKRALAFMLLVGFAFGGFVFMVAPLLTTVVTNEYSTIILVAFSILTGLVYPLLRRGAERFIDEVILKRVNYVELTSTLSRDIDDCQNPVAILDKAIRILGPALSAQKIEWEATEENDTQLWIQQDRQSARVRVPTADKPAYILSIRDLAGGRRLLSDDIAMLERAALLLARRIDATRSFQERYRRNLEEQEVRKLAAEAELRALRAQINPHFLFNALTTIGYLIQTAPERAFTTLMRLSGLLRGVLKSSDEFVSVGEELDLIEAYLDIERARFEDRLRVHIDVPWELRRIRIPALILQPLVENGIEHGISESMSGGEIRIAVRLENNLLLVSIRDTGMGTTDAEVERGKKRGLGLSNVEQRLKRYGAKTTALSVKSTPGLGTTVEVRIPVQHAEVAATV